MFELFGFLPLVKILGIVFFLFYFSFLIGRFISWESTENKGLQFFIGLSSILSVVAIINSLGLTVFTPSFISILVLFKPKIKFSNLNWQKAFKCTLQLFGLFIPFLLIELYRQSFFSKEFFNAGFGDYQFYIDTAQNIWKEGVESSLAYLTHYDLPTATNIYHYYDLYLLVPIFIFEIPPLIGYFFYFLPLVYSIAVFSLFQISKSRKNRLLILLIAFFSIHIPGIEIPELVSFKRLTMIHYPKACFMIFPVLILTLRDKWGLNKTLVAATFLSLMLNPLIFINIGATSLSMFFLLKKKRKLKFVSFFNWECLLVYACFIVYFVLVFSSKSDNSVLFTFMDNPSLSQFFTEVFKRFVGYSGVVKKLPILVIAALILFYRFYKTNKIQFEVVFISVTFIIGHIVNSLMYNHYEGMQFFNFSIVTMISIYFLFAAQSFQLNLGALNKIGVALLLLVSTGVYISGGYTLFTEPRTSFKTSVGYNKNLKKAINKREEVNSLFFKNFTDETHWIRTIPYLTYGLGYLNLHQNSNCILPTDPNMFLNSYTVKKNAINLISRGPFSLYCQKMNLSPTSFYDENFKVAILGFIDKYNINVLIFEKEMIIPEWVDEFDSKVFVYPEQEYDQHLAIVL
jgi:hypothetical protein